ncbi:MAG: glycosyltransferase family 4 protein [Bryobacteraceae bacterium]
MSRLRKILFVITRAEMGGAQTHVVDLLRGMQGRVDGHVATGEHGYLTETAAAMGVPFSVLPDLVQPTHPWKDNKALLALRRVIAELRPDIVHTHTSKAGTLGRLAARLAGVPAIFTAHSWAFSEGVSWKWKAIGIPTERLAARWTSRIINVSEANRRLALAHRVGAPGLHVTIHNGIEDSPLRATPGEDSAEPRVIMVARFAAQKNHRLLLDAAASLARPFRLVLVGDGPLRTEMEALARTLGIASRVEFTGERRDVGQLLASSHVFALATNWEGLPISILEALRAGLPVVSSDVGGVNEMVTEGGNGFLVNPGDTPGFAGVLDRLLADSAMRAHMGRASRTRFENEFTSESMIEKTLTVYQGVLSGGALPSPTVLGAERISIHEVTQ